jgi:hypothetical protein
MSSAAVNPAQPCKWSLPETRPLSRAPLSCRCADVAGSGHQVTSPFKLEPTHPVLAQHEARQAVTPPTWLAFRSSVRCDRILEVWIRLAGGAQAECRWLEVAGAFRQVRQRTCRGAARSGFGHRGRILCADPAADAPASQDTGGAWAWRRSGLRHCGVDAGWLRRVGQGWVQDAVAPVRVGQLGRRGVVPVALGL